MRGMISPKCLVFLALLAMIPFAAQAAVSKISANFTPGAIVVGPDSNTCNTALQGAIRFTSSTTYLAFCDGVNSGWTTIGGGSAAGANTQIQFNSSSALGASSNFTWDIINNIVTIANSGTGAVRAGSGTVSLPGHSFTAGTSTGMFMSGAGTLLDFSVGGIEALQLGTVGSGVNYFKITPGATGAAPIFINAGSDTNGTGLGIALTAKTATAAGAGGPITMTAGAGNGTGAGGAVSASGGTPGTTGAGGAVGLTAGNGGATSGNGGSVTLTAGTVTSGTAGNLIWNLGANTYLTAQAPGTANASIIFGGNDAVSLPSGATGGQPSTPVNGMIRYNTTTSKIEGYQAGAWTNLISSASTTIDALTDGMTNNTGSGNSNHSMFLINTPTTIPTGGDSQAGIGAGAMASTTGQSEGTAFGALALSSATDGAYNTAFGAQAECCYAKGVATGNNDIAFGYNALNSSKNGNEVAIGANTIVTAVYPSDGQFTAMGYNALHAATQTNGALGFGSRAGELMGVGTNYTMAIGALANTNNAVFGTGSESISIGYAAGNFDGYYNVGIGALAFTSAAVNPEGSNTGIGKGMGLVLTSGVNNVFLGYQAGSTTTTGGVNLLIGSGVNASTATVSNELNIGNLVRGITGGANSMKFDAQAHMKYIGTALTNPGAGVCGTNAATIAGNDNVMKVTSGTGAGVTTCTVTFKNSWTNTPICNVTAGTASAAGAYVSAASTTAITVTWPTSSASQVLYIMCRGYL